MSTKPESGEIQTGANDREGSDDSDFSLVQRAVAAGLVDQEDAGRVLREMSTGDSLPESLRDTGATVDSIPDTAKNTAGDDFAAQPSSLVQVQETAAASETGAPVDVEARWGLAGLPERYQVERLIGQGGMGAVYAAFDQQLRRRVAVKVLKGDRFRTLRGKLMFRECQLLAALEDPGIVTVFDAGTLEDGSPYFIMRCVEGRNLDEHVAEQNLGWRQILDLMARICDAAHRAHLLRIVHRDLKPKNIKITAEGAPVILDFGLAKAVGEASAVADGPAPQAGFETIGGGTPGYMSPEQAAGEAVDQRTDVYALGVILYQLLSGHLPSENDQDPLGRLFRADETAWKGRPTLASLRSVSPHVPRDVAAIVERCLESDRQRRYQDCAALAADLRRAVAGDTVSIYASGHPWYRLRKFVRRHRASVIACAAVVIAFAVAAVSGLLSWKNKIEMDAKLVSQQREAELQHEADRELARRQQEAQDTLLQRTHTDAAARFLRDQEYTLAYQELKKVPSSRLGFECRLMAAQTRLVNKPSSILGCHEYEVLCLLGRQDGKSVVTSGLDGRVLLWDLASRSSKSLREGIWCSEGRHWRHALGRADCDPQDDELPDPCISLCWLDGQQRLAGATRKGALVIWNLTKGGEEKVYQHPSGLTAAATSPSGQIMLGGVQGELLLASADALGAPKKLDLTGACITDIVSISGGRWCVGREDGELTVLAADGGQILERKQEAAPIWDLDVDHSGQKLAAACGSPSVVTFACESSAPLVEGRSVLALPKRGQETVVPQTVRFGRDGRLYAADNQGRIVAWNTKTPSVDFVLDDPCNGPSGALPDSLPAVFRRRVAGFVTLPGSRTLVTAGCDTYVKRWDLFPPLTTVQLPPKAHVAFDPQALWLFWVAAGRSLRLVDSRDGRALYTTPDLPDEITYLDISPGCVAATCCAGAIHFWRRQDQQLIEQTPSIHHDVALRSVSLSADGSRVAAYDQRNNVLLWELPSRKVVARQALNEGDEVQPSLAGLVQFNRQGTRLAVLGPGASAFVLAGDDLGRLSSPYVAAGAGGTAVTWHPVRDDLFVAGDSEGSLRPYATNPAPMLDLTSLSRVDLSPVVGLTFTPDGSRLARARESGHVAVYDPQWLGEVFAFESPHYVEAKVPLSQLTFDPTGQRLAVVHEDGVVQIWESAPVRLPRAIPIRPKAAWTKQAWTLDVKDAAIELNQSCVALDGKDHVCLLYQAVATRKDGKDIRLDGRLLLSHEQAGGPRTVAVGQWPNVDSQAMIHQAYTLALGHHDGHLVAIYGQTPPNAKSIVRELVLFRPDAPPGEVHEVITDVMNLGFRPSLSWDMAGEATITHFAFGGFYLLCTRRENGQWTTFPLGRQGDGKSHVSACDSQGRLHVATKTHRFNSDPDLGLYYLAFDKPTSQATSEKDSDCPREFIDPEVSFEPISISVDQRGRPSVLYGRQGAAAALERPHKPWEIRWARRADQGWVRQVLLTNADPSFAVSNHVETEDDRFCFAYSEAGSQGTRVLLAEGTHGRWLAQPIGTLPTGPATPRGTIVPLLVVRVDSHQRPVVVCIQNQDGVCRVTVYQQPSPVPALKQDGR